MFNYNNFYIIKTFDNKIFHFYYQKNKGIIYKAIEEKDMYKSLELEEEKNCSGNYNIAVENSTEKFSAFLLLDDDICIIYEDKLGNINLNVYNGYQWKNKIIIQNKNKDRFSIYFNGFLYNEQINIIYNVMDKEKENSTIFHQNFSKDDDDLYTTKVIDKINYYDNSFKFFISNEGWMIILYCKFKKYHYIGYKIYIKEEDNWSDFHIIDYNNDPFEDYYINAIDNSLQIIYRNKHNEDKIVYNVKNRNLYDNKLKTENKQLKESIDFFQNEVICKEEKINFLENGNIEKENKIKVLEEEIVKLNEYIKDLDLKGEKKQNLFRRIFNK